MSAENAFRVVDIDFDGTISKKDLTSFLKEVLKIPNEEITPSRIGRLFKLMDIFKRNTIQLNDFKKVICNNLTDEKDPNNPEETHMQTISSFNWKLHGKQQIGLLLSKQFNNLHQSFEGIIF